MAEPKWIETCRVSVREKSMVRYKRQAIDLFTASAIVAVWDKLNDTNREKLCGVYDRRGVAGVAAICFQFVK